MNQPITCALVDERELDRKYVAGQLNDDEAAAFEEHYFACDRCWALVKGGADVRSAHVGVVSLPRLRRTWMMPLSIAAGIMLVALGTWRVIGSDGVAMPDTIRGIADSIVVSTTTTTAHWEAAWASLPEAASYRIRVFSEDGQVLLTREATDTTVRLTADTLATMARGKPLYMEVQRLDQLQRTTGRSPLIPITPPR